MLLGCVADDLTGATDLSLMLSREGLRTVQTTGLPEADLDLDDVDAVVVALKSRTIPADDAVAQSIAAAERLKNGGAKRLFFKYCSTFDFDRSGQHRPGRRSSAWNASAFRSPSPALRFRPTAVPSTWASSFVGGVPLAESSMRDHPLTPMRDSDLRRVLRRQTRGEVGHVAYPDVDAGPAAIRAAFTRELGARRPDRHCRCDHRRASARHRCRGGGSRVGHRRFRRGDRACRRLIATWGFLRSYPAGRSARRAARPRRGPSRLLLGRHARPGAARDRSRAAGPSHRPACHCRQTHTAAQ